MSKYIDKDEIAFNFMLGKVLQYCGCQYSQTAYIGKDFFEELGLDLKIPTAELQRAIYPLMQQGDNMIHQHDVARAILKMERPKERKP